MGSKVVLLGGSGGVGSAIFRELLTKNFTVVHISRSELDLSKKSTAKKISKILTIHQPDIVINCTGVFGDNEIDFNKIFNVNVKANWDIIKHYKENPPLKTVKFITIGSSSYNSGRKNYILYAATKAALFNIYQGASEYFADKKLIIGLINPGKIRTPMIEHLLKEDTVCLDPKDVAQQIITFLVDLKKSSFININS